MNITKKRLLEIIKEEIELSEMGDRCFPDDEGGMALNQLQNISDYSQELMMMIKPGMQLEGWVQSKLTLAKDYVSKVKHYLEGELQERDQMTNVSNPLPVEETDENC